MTGTGRDDPGVTIAELCAATGKSDQWVRPKLKALQSAGRLVVGRKTVVGLDGKGYPVPAYRIAK